LTLLYDSTNPNDIPAGVWAAGYVDGIYAWDAAGWARFPGAKRIAVFGQTNDGDCLDVERGDATPSEAPQWVQWRRAAGVPVPWVYVNRSNRSTVEAALAAAGVMSDQVALWVATLDGTQTVPAGPYVVAAVQYAGSGTSGGHYDLSVVNQTFGPGGGTLGGKKAKMFTTVDSGGTGYFFTGGALLTIHDVADLTGLEGAGIQRAKLTDGFIAELKAIPSGSGGTVTFPKGMTGTFTGTLV
jgi:hypothetical protein